VFQLLTEFFGQSGENILCAKKFGPSKMKFRGLLALKREKIWSQNFLPLHLFSALFLSNAAEFLSIWYLAQDYNRFCRYSASETDADICKQFLENGQMGDT
jgi:hypothetical protein